MALLPNLKQLVVHADYTEKHRNIGGQIYPDFSHSKLTRSFDIESILWKGVPSASIGRTAVPLRSDRLSNKEEPAVATITVAAEGERSYVTLAEWVESSAATGATALEPFLPISGRHSGQEDDVTTEPSAGEAIAQGLNY